MADEWGGIMRPIVPEIEKADKIKKKIFAWLKTNRKLITVAGAEAIAKRFEKFGDRSIEISDFLNAAAEKTEGERNGCLKVEIKKAEELLGKAAVDAISSRPTVAGNSLELTVKAK